MTSALKRDKRTREEVDAIVLSIAKRMGAGDWVTGESGQALAEDLGVSLSMVRQWSTQASRIAWAGDDDQIHGLRVETMSSLHRIARKAEQSNEWRAAIDALDKAAQVVGAKPPQGTAVQINMLVDASGNLHPRVQAELEQATAQLVGIVDSVLSETLTPVHAEAVRARLRESIPVWPIAMVGGGE